MSEGAPQRRPLHWYSVVWLGVLAPAGFFACLAGLMVGPRASILAMGGLGAVMAALTAVPLDPRAGPSPLAATGRGAVAATAARRAVCVGAGVLLVGALMALLGGMMVPLLAVVAITSPRALRWVSRQMPAPAGRPGRIQRPVRNEEYDVARLRTELLCKEWRASYRRVSQAPSMHLLTEQVLRRQQVLDEMERRNAAGFHAWLETNPTAYDDPECFLAAEVESKGPPQRD